MNGFMERCPLWQILIVIVILVFPFTLPTGFSEDGLKNKQGEGKDEDEIRQNERARLFDELSRTLFPDEKLGKRSPLFAPDIDSRFSRDSLLLVIEIQMTLLNPPYIEKMKDIYRKNNCGQAPTEQMISSWKSCFRDSFFAELQQEERWWLEKQEFRGFTHYRYSSYPPETVNVFPSTPNNECLPLIESPPSETLQESREDCFYKDLCCYCGEHYARKLTLQFAPELIKAKRDVKPLPSSAAEMEKHLPHFQAFTILKMIEQKKEMKLQEVEDEIGLFED